MTWVLAKLGPWILAALAFVGGFWKYGQAKKKEANTERDLRDAKAVIKTHERMNDADTHHNHDDDELKRLLAERGKRNNHSG